MVSESVRAVDIFQGSRCTPLFSRNRSGSVIRLNFLVLTGSNQSRVIPLYIIPLSSTNNGNAC